MNGRDPQASTRIKQISSFVKTRGLAGADVGCAHEEFDRGLGAQSLEVDDLLENRFERIIVERIELIWRQHPGEIVEEHIAGRMLQAVIVGQPVEPRRLNYALRSRVGKF